LQNQKCKIEYFVFNCAFFTLDHEISEVLELFDILDRNGDGYLDSSEFDLIFQGVKESWNSHSHDITQSVLRSGIKMGRNVDISQAYNTLDKFGPAHNEMHGYPHFFGKTLKNISKRETSSRNSARKQKRTLSIVTKEGKALA